MGNTKSKIAACGRAAGERTYGRSGRRLGG
jgi:hypothetical protein